MRVERRSGADERRIVIGMITDPVVLGRVAARWDRENGLFASPWANIVGGWCVSYYAHFDGAPGRAIESQFERWVAKHPDDRATADLIEGFLRTLSAEYEQQEYSSEYILDIAAGHFNRVRLRRLATAIEGHLDNNDLENAVRQVSTWGAVEIGGSAGIDVFQNTEALRQAFEQKSEPLITYPGALGEFFGGSLERDAFISFLAPEKRGKTWWLLDMAWRAALQRRRVALFEVGDMSEAQVMRRFGIRAACHPSRARTCHWPTSVSRNDPDFYATATHEERVFDEGLSWQAAHAAFQATLERSIKSKDTYLKLSVHPNDSISVHGIRSICQGWEREGWVPDIVVVDYADILAPPEGAGRESRDQINKTWKQLRALSQSQHCLVVTATQSDADSYSRDTIGRSNFSEDKRKFAHVTGMVGINQSHDEKHAGIMRLNWVVLREDEFYETRCVHVAGCLALGNPAVRSCA